MPGTLAAQRASKFVRRSTWNSARWARRAVREVRVDLAENEPGKVSVSGPPPTTSTADTGVVRRILRLERATCLERALVLQRWYGTHGRPVAIVIGVSNGEEFGAHAWLDGSEPESEAAFTSILRIEPDVETV